MGYEKYKVHRHVFLWDLGGTGNSSTATGVIPIFTIPDTCKILKVSAQVLTAVTGSTAEEVGDGNDVDGYIVDNFAASTGAYPLSAEDATCGVYQKATTAGATDALDVSNSAEAKYYASSDTIDFKISGTATAGKIRFFIDFELVA